MNQLKQLFEELNEIKKTIVNSCEPDDPNTLEIKYDRLAIRFHDLENRLVERHSTHFDDLDLF